MSGIVVEDATGLANANANASYAQATTYWADRGTVVAGTQTQVEQALIRATDFLDQRFA